MTFAWTKTCKFSKTEIKFYGHIFSSNGLKPNPRKVETIRKARPPQNHREVKSLLGMAQYVSPFIPNYVTITTPLPCWRDRTRLGNGSNKNKKALNGQKEVLVEDQVMSYFDPKIEDWNHRRCQSIPSRWSSDTRGWSSWLCKSCTEGCWKPKQREKCLL